MSQITVIVPVYKVEPYLRRCVDSILSQTFTDFDLILIDDGSPDLCGEICEEYAVNDSRVHVIHHEKNLGLSAARNSGIEWALQESNSEWISFVDSDDWVHPLYLEALFNAAQGYDLSIGGRIYTKGEEPQISNTGSIILLKPEDLCCENFGNAIVAWGKLYKKTLFTTIRYPVGHVYEDAFITYKILFRYQVLPFINLSIYYYFYNPDSITHTIWNPNRLDELQATIEQISYFIRYGFLNIAKKRFDCFRNTSEYAVKRIKESITLTDSEKTKHIQTVRKMQRKALLMCHRYKWCSIWNRGKDLWFYSNAFPSVHVLHMVWRRMKNIGKSIFSSNS